MKIKDLIQNDEFEFNVPFRIIGVGNIIYDEKGNGIDVELTVMYDDSKEDNTAPIDSELLEEYIVAINETDGVIDIEYAL